MDSVTIQLTKAPSSEGPAAGEGTATVIQAQSFSNDTLKSIGHDTNTNSSITPTLSSTLTNITIEIIDGELFDALSVASLIPSLRKDGKGQVIIKVKKNSNGDNTLLSNIHTGILLAGLTAESESKESNDDGDEWRVITSKYKPPQTSASTITVARINTATSTKKKNTIQINLDMDDDGDDDLINEDDLLNDDGMGLVNAPPVMEARPKEEDCGGRKPCDNCTCGRAEAEAEAENKPQNDNVETRTRPIIKDMKSSCGNCSKGDAFRCAGCPFLGKPAFKEGEEHLVLDLTDDL